MTVRFPQVSATNLERKRLTMPQDFEGQVNILLIAFQQWQQGQVNTWIPAVQQLEAGHPGLSYYELPTIRPLNRLARAFINSGMRAGIPDRLARARTITLYLDKKTFRKALELEDEEHIYVLLIDQEGHVLWRERGVFTADKRDALQTQLAQLLAEADE